MRYGETVRLQLPNWMDARRFGLERELDFGCRIGWTRGDSVWRDSLTSVAELDGRAEMRYGETVRFRLPNWMDARRFGLERQLDFGCRIEWTR